MSEGLRLWLFDGRVGGRFCLEAIACGAAFVGFVRGGGRGIEADICLPHLGLFGNWWAGGVNQALISLSDKRDVEVLAKGLTELG